MMKELGIIGRIDNGKTTTADRLAYQVGNTALANIRNDHKVVVSEDIPHWLKPTPLPIFAAHRIPEPYIEYPKMGVTGKPPRNKKKAKAQRKARKRNF